MGKITVRVRTRASTLRINIDDSATVRMLKEMIEKECGVPQGDQVLARDPRGTDTLNSSSSLSSLRFRNGEMVHLIGDVGARSSTAGAAGGSGGGGAAAGAGGVAGGGGSSGGARARPGVKMVIEHGRLVPASESKMGDSAASAPRVLTKDCNHGPRGACRHCCVPDDKKPDEPLNKAYRYTSRHTSTAGKAPSGEEISDELEWLCTHGPHQMCVNCAPLQKGDTVDLEMLCQHGPGQQCVNCLPPDSLVERRKHVTFDEYIAKKKAKCEHVFSANCVNCAPPSDVSYKIKPGCTKHKPWPHGLCNDCQPPAVVLARQPYRHVDYIEARNVAELQRLVDLWRSLSFSQQRAAYLYGRYEPDPNFPKGRKAVVEAIYEPPQLGEMEGVKLLADPRESTVNAIAGAMGLERVGWAFTHFPREHVLSSGELRQMARFQNAAPRSDAPGSLFVTMSITNDGTGNVVPSGFMASDTLMALERDDVLSDSKIPEKFQAREPSGHDVVPDVIENVTGRGITRVKQFGVEYLLVQLGAGMPKAGAPVLFKHSDFPIENRTEFGEVQSRAELKSYLAKHSSEPLHEALSNFHVLLYLAHEFDKETAVAIAERVASKSSVPEGLKLLLDNL